MADKKLESITFPDLPDRYVVKPDIADVTGLQTALDGKADTEDVYNAFVTENLTGSIASFTDGADDIPVKSLVAEIVPLQSGSGDPSPDNVRAISGWSSVDVSVSGINVWDEEWEVGGINNTTGEPTISNDRIRSKNFCACLPSTVYYGKNAFISGDPYLYIWFYDANKNFINGSGLSNGTITTPQNARYFKLSTYGGNYTEYHSGDFSINYPSTDTSYHAYNGEVYTISFASAGTVYGGSIDVTTGVLTVDRVMIVGGWEQYAQNNGYKAYRQNNAPARKSSTFADNGGMSNMLKEFGTFSSGSMDKNVCELPPTSPATNMIYVALDENADVSGLQISYLIANPQTYQLTPTEVKTLLGNNNIWADTGDIDLTYRADLGLYLDKIINA